MVSGKVLIAILGITAFILAGGGSLIRPAFAQAQEDFSSVRTTLTEQVKNIRNKTNAGKTGESVG